MAGFCRICCWRRSSPSPLFSFTGLRRRRCTNRSCARTRSDCRRSSSASRTTRTLFAQPEYYHAIVTTVVFSTLVAALSLSIALLFASQADKNLKAATGYKTLLIWPYAVAPAIAGVLWIFMFHPSLGTLARPLRVAGFDWNPHAERQPRAHADRDGRRLEADLLQFPVLSRRPAVDPAQRDRGERDRRRAAQCGASGPSSFRCCRRPRSSCSSSTSSMCSSTRSASSTPSPAAGRPAPPRRWSTRSIADGRLGGDLGGSAAQSVILMIIVIGLTAVQFRYVERKVQY